MAPSPATLHWAAPAGAPGVLIVPGYGSRKENHRDFGEALQGAGMAAAAVDLRGHGETGGAREGRGHAYERAFLLHHPNAHLLVDE